MPKPHARPHPLATRAYRHRLLGWGLGELLVTVAITALLLTIGLPAFGPLLGAVRQDGDLNALNAALTLARTEAIKRGQPVAVCPGERGCSDSTDWSGGWSVQLLGKQPQVLAQTPGYTRGQTLAAQSAGDDSYPRFTPLGYTFFNGSLVLHERSNTPELRRCIFFRAGAWTLAKGVACP